MLDLFKEIEGLQGVTGTFAHIRGLGMIYAELPDGYTAETLRQFESFVEQVRHAAREAKTENPEAEITLPEAVILVRSINEQATLIVVAGVDLNRGLLQVTLDLLQDELRQEAENLCRNRGMANSPTDNREQGSRWQPPDSLPAEVHGVVARLAASLRQAVGPLASVIMEQSVAGWLQAGEASRGRIDELIEVLCMEIGDPEIESRFRADAASVLP